MDEESGVVYSLDEALDAVGFGKFQVIVLFCAGFGSLADAFEIMILSFMGLAVKAEWGLSSTQESFLTSVVFAGMLIGAYFWGLVSDNYGRRQGILGSTVLISGAGFLSTFSPNYIVLLALRCLVGIGLGGSPVFTTWFLEFVPTSNRGMWMVVFCTFGTFGTILESSLAWIVMPKMGWRWLLAFSSLPSIALLVIYCFAPESPRYLCTKGRTNEAQKILEKMALLNQTNLPAGMLVSDGKIGLDEGSSSCVSPLLSSAREKVSNWISGFSSFYMLFSSKLIQTTLLLWLLYFSNSFSYYGIILLTSELSGGQSRCSSTILHLENLPDESLYSNALITSLGELPGLLICAVIVDRVGRKLSLILLSLLACMFLLPLISHQSGTLRILLLFGARMSALAKSNVACIYCQELYPTVARTTGVGAAYAVGRIGGVICPLVAVGLVTSCHVKEAIILFEIVICVSGFCLLFFPFETKGRKLSDKLSAFDPKRDYPG